MSYPTSNSSIFGNFEMINSSDLSTFGDMNSINQVYTPTEGSVIKKTQFIFNEIMVLREQLANSQGFLEDMANEYGKFKQEHQHCDSLRANLKSQEEKTSHLTEQLNHLSLQSSKHSWTEKRHSLEQHTQKLKNILADAVVVEELVDEDLVIIERAIMSTCNAIDMIFVQMDSEQSIGERDINDLVSSLGNIKDNVSKETKLNTTAKRRFIAMQESLVDDIKNPVFVFNKSSAPPDPHFIQLRHNFEKMKEEKKELDLQISKNNETIMELDKELRFANSKCRKLGRLLSEKDDRIKSLEDEINEKSVVFPSTPNDKDAKIRDLEGQNAKFQAQYAELQNKVRAVEQDLFEASQSNETLSDENDVLKERLRVVQFECQKLENVLSENNVLKEKLQEAQFECHKFENVLREKEDFIKCLESKCSNPELKELIQNLENKVNNLENDKQVLAEKIENLEGSNLNLKRANVSLKQMQSKYLNELEKTKAELNESATSGNTSLDEHDFSIISHNSFNVSEVNSAEEMMQSSNNEEETKHLQEELVEFKNKFKQLEMENQNEIQLKMKLLDYLEQKELDILQNGNVEDNLNKEDFVERFEHLFVNYKERIKNMSDKYNELLNTNVLKSSEKADDGKQYEEYQRQLGDFQNQTSNLENQIDQLKNHSVNLENQIDQLKNHSVNLENQIDQLKNHSVNLENQIDQLKNHSVNLEKQIHNYKIHTENLENEIAECVSQIQNYENEIERLNEQIGSCKKQINNMSLNVSQKETQIDQMKNDYEKQHALLNDKLEKSKQEHKDTWQKSQAILREEEEKVEQLGIELRSARMQLENVIRAKEEEVNQYKLLYDNLDRAKASAESEIEARKIQTEIFQGDFEAERQAREKQQEELLKRRDEVDALKEEVEGLRREIQRITNQNFQNRRQYQGDSQSDLDRSGNNRQSFYGNDEWQRPHSRQGREEIREMPCPKCQQNFPDGESLQIHFMDCIE